MSRKGRRVGKTRAAGGRSKPNFEGSAFPAITWSDLWSLGSQVAMSPDMQIQFRLENVVHESIDRVRAARA